MFQKILVSVASVSLALMPVSAYAAPNTNTASKAALSAVSVLYSTASAGLCMGAPGGCVLPLKAPKPTTVTRTAVVKTTPPPETGKNSGGLLIGILGVVAVAGIIVAISGGDDDDEPASP